MLSAGVIAVAQEGPPTEYPREFDLIIQQMRFDQPTRIEGTFLIFDAYDDAVWIEWTGVYDGHAWRGVPDQHLLLLYPRDDEMLAFFRKVPKGTVLRMLIQRAPDNKRRILALEGA
jgi:hypothetical protein